MKKNNINWYTSQFPESLYPCSSSRVQEYAAHVIEGKEIASQSNVLICGIVRNAERVLPYTLARIERLGFLFHSWGAYIFENDSTDNTLSILQKWHDETPNICIEHENLSPPSFDNPHGIVRRRFMAMARNKYLNFARRFIYHQSVHFVIILDMDLWGGWSYHGILNSLGQSSVWDVVGSNSLVYKNEQDRWGKLFYDSWAFRPLDHPEPLDDHEANLFVFHRGEPLVQVNSCFGGLAIYKPHFLSEGIDYDETDCDHPTLHNQLVNRGYKIFLNPSQITLYNKHGYVV